MKFLRSMRHKMLLTLPGILIATTLAAQTSTAVKPASSGYNQLAILLILLMVVLALVIWGMGQVLTVLGRQLLDKDKVNRAPKILSMVLVAGLSLLSQVTMAAETPVAVAAATTPDYGGLTASAYYIFLTVIGMELVVILFLAFSIRRMYVELLPRKVKQKAPMAGLAGWWKRMDSRLFTKAVAVEREKDILLDHDYDGIQELDNSLPPWWKYGFYITIGIAFIYMLNFHVLGTGQNPTEEYNTEMEMARIEKEIYEANNKDKIDESNVPMPDADGIVAGQRLFEANCAACHLKDGGGSVGPNLTDNYWLHKGTLNDIYASIKNGYADKGMQAWSSSFSPGEISNIAGFIKSLRGTKPPVAKEQQGEFFVDPADSAAAARPVATVIKN